MYLELIQRHSLTTHNSQPTLHILDMNVIFAMQQGISTHLPFVRDRPCASLNKKSDSGLMLLVLVVPITFWLRTPFSGSLCLAPWRIRTLGIAAVVWIWDSHC